MANWTYASNIGSAHGIFMFIFQYIIWCFRGLKSKLTWLLPGGGGPSHYSRLKRRLSSAGISQQPLGLWQAILLQEFVAAKSDKLLGLRIAPEAVQFLDSLKPLLRRLQIEGAPDHHPVFGHRLSCLLAPVPWHGFLAPPVAEVAGAGFTTVNGAARSGAGTSGSSPCSVIRVTTLTPNTTIAVIEIGTRPARNRNAAGSGCAPISRQAAARMAASRCVGVSSPKAAW